VIRPGTILAAHPDLQDQRFAASTILITESHDAGTYGYVLNKAANISLGEALANYRLNWPMDDKLYIGGPVPQNSLIMIHTSDWYSSNTMPVTDELSISSDNFMIEKMLCGNQPKYYRFVTGMAGWRPGQLEKELKNKKSWLTCDSDSRIVFVYDSDRQWHQTIKQCATQTINNFL